MNGLRPAPPPDATGITEAVSPDHYLLVTAAEMDAARQKADAQPWAARAHDRVIAEAERAHSSPVHVPERGGQWNLWYSCKRDGRRLETVSATEHRCPACGTVYTGEPYDSVVVSMRHDANAEAVLNLALAYRLTERRVFADHAGEILRGYAARYPSYPRRDKWGEDQPGGARVFSQTLDEARWLVQVVWAYCLVQDTLSPDTRRRIETDFLLPAAALLRADHWGVHNKQCWMNAAFGLVGFAVGDAALIAEAIDHPERGFRAMIARGVTDDGLWWEGSASYHAMVLHALVLLAEAARCGGIDLYMGRFLRMWEAPLALAMPDGDAPGFNDGSATNVFTLGPLYEIGYARTRRPAYGRLVAATARDSREALLVGLEETPSGSCLPERSTLLAASGCAVLRSPEVAVAVRFGLHGGGHGHMDKLSIVTHGAGASFGLDPGTVAYSVPLYEGWYRATLAHNTVLMSRGTQAPVNAGTAEHWGDEPDRTTLTVTTDSAYPDTLLRRTLTLRGHELDDRFECFNPVRHGWEWVFHSPGAFTASLDFRPLGKPLGASDGYQYVANVAEAYTDGEWWARWEQGDARLTLHFAAAPGTRIFSGVGPGKATTRDFAGFDPAGDTRGGVPMLIVRRLSINAVFAATHRYERIAR